MVRFYTNSFPLAGRWIMVIAMAATVLAQDQWPTPDQTQYAAPVGAAVQVASAGGENDGGGGGGGGGGTAGGGAYAGSGAGEVAAAGVAAVGAAGGAGGVQWITPTASDALVPGGQLLAQWRSDTLLDTPSFALCTAGSCGQASYPTISHHADGTSSATLSLPDMPDMSGMYLSMDPGSGYAQTTSPTFNVNLAGTAVTPGDEDSSTNAPTPTGMAVAESPVTEDSKSHKGHIVTEPATPASFPTALVSGLTAGIPTGPIATGTFQSVTSLTGSPLPGMTNLPSLPVASSSPSMAIKQLAAVRPNAVAIAVPLAIVGLILVAALIFCARNKMFRGPRKDEENWHEAVKAKVAAGLATDEAGVKGVPAMSQVGVSNGVSVTQRPAEFNAVPVAFSRGNANARGGRDDDREFRQFQAYNFDSSRDGSSYSRSRTPSRDDAVFTRLPSHTSDRDRRRSGRAERWDRQCEDESSADRYYSTSRRSTSSIGGMSECSCAHHASGRRGGSGSSKTSRSSRSGRAETDEKYMYGRPDTLVERDGSRSWSNDLPGIVNQHPPSPHPPSMTPRLGPPAFRPSASYSRSSRDGRGLFADAPSFPQSDTRRSSAARPLPSRGDDYDAYHPNRTGILERGLSEASTDSVSWNVREKRTARSADPGMDGLYESLRLAIGSPAV